jgi:hypothetical protein
MAVLLIWTLVGLLAIRTLLTIVLLDSLIDAFAAGRGDAALGREFIEGAAPAYVPIALISLVLFGGLLALCAIFVGKGAGWARITAIVLSVLVLLGALLGIFLQASTILFIVVNVLVAVTAAGVIYYLLRPNVKGQLAG